MRYFNRFGDEEYTGPGSPGYTYSTPSSDIASSYTSEYTDPNRTYPGAGSYVDPSTGAEVVTHAPPTSDYVEKSYPVSPPAAEGPGFDWGGLVGGFVNIFGQPQRRAPPPPLPPTTPSWVIPVAIGAGVLVLGGILLVTGKRSSVAGYRKKRKSCR